MPNYQLSLAGSGVMLDGKSIPKDEMNGDYIRYTKWTQAGNSPAPAIELPLAEEQAAAQVRIAGEAVLKIQELAPDGAAAVIWQAETDSAVAAQADQTPLTDENYPLLAALVGAMGEDLDEVAAALIGRRDALASHIAAVHAKRTETQLAIDAAVTVSAVRAAVADIAWPALPTPV